MEYAIHGLYYEELHRSFSITMHNSEVQVEDVATLLCRVCVCVCLYCCDKLSLTHLVV